jgi:hypothetical protein
VTSASRCCSKGRDFALTDIELIVQPVVHWRPSEVVAAHATG